MALRLSIGGKNSMTKGCCPSFLGKDRIAEQHDLPRVGIDNHQVEVKTSTRPSTESAVEEHTTRR